MNKWSTVPVQKLSWYLDNFYMHHSSNVIPIVIACNTAYLPRNTFSQIIARVKFGIFMALTITANYINFYTRLFMFPTSIRFFVSLIDFHFCFPLCCLNDRETVVIFSITILYFIMMMYILCIFRKQINVYAGIINWMQVEL